MVTVRVYYICSHGTFDLSIKLIICHDRIITIYKAFSAYLDHVATEKYKPVERELLVPLYNKTTLIKDS